VREQTGGKIANQNMFKAKSTLDIVMNETPLDKASGPPSEKGTWENKSKCKDKIR